MIAFLTSKLGIAVIAGVAVLGAIVWIYREGKDAGHADTLKKTIEIQRSITDADAAGPRTPDDVDRRLRDGSF